jgi:hypothetical protein
MLQGDASVAHDVQGRNAGQPRGIGVGRVMRPRDLIGELMPVSEKVAFDRIAGEADGRPGIDHVKKYISEIA